MAKSQINFGELNGGGVDIDLSLFVQGTAEQSFPATVGKKYLVTYYHGGGGGSVASGGTVDYQFQYSLTVSSATRYIYLAVVTATASTVVMSGSGNNVYYLQID